MITPRITIKGDFTRLERIRKEFAKARNAYATVGIHEDAGEYEDGTSVVQVALYNEFGTEHIPSRPFIRSAVLGKEATINAWRIEVIRRIMLGEISVRKALEILGFRLREMIRNNINANMPPPNAPSTAAHKVREGVAPRALVETGLLLRSVEFRVVGI